MPNASRKCNKTDAAIARNWSWGAFGLAAMGLGIVVAGMSSGDAQYESIEILYDETGGEGGSSVLLGWVAGGVALVLVGIAVLVQTRLKRQIESLKEQLDIADSRLREAQLIARIGSWTRDFETGQTFWSEEACKVLGLEGREQDYKHYERLIHPDDIDKVTEVVAAAYHQGGAYQCDHRVICPGNVEKYVRLAGQVYLGGGHAPVRETGTVQDITQQHLAELAVLSSEQRLRSILDVTPYPILIVEQSEYFPLLYANVSTYALFNLDQNQGFEDLRLQHFWQEPTELTKFIADIATANVSGREALMVTAEGKHFWAELTGRIMDYSGVDALFITLEDVTERRQMLADLERLATTDSLTGILNRRSFIETLQRELRRSVRYRHPLTVLMLDIDHFKKVNDNYGHAFGDEVLRRFCDVAKSCLREEDLLGRIGGEEFAAVLVSSEQGGGYVVAERIRKRWQEEVFEIQGGRCNFTVSIGVAQLQSDLESIEDILERADKGLYHAKRSGRNSVIVYNGDASPDVKQRG